ncbi:Pentatricopeptide repeat-containing protein [Cynara cardunculus var. scolymus]|uniref:Pentatricopeptide repeat-containing protein n=1 Tax=Cynara cardunculus var. scolymus TaxID=59895 RepID=A0A103YBP2_CYNCS|nr:Pentatricopeptide repeat-containing protein [Cynara cardunculus var. scolymus]
MIFCKQSTDLIRILKNHCKSIKEIHQIHAQIITRGLLSLHPSSTSPLLTTILHTFNSLLSAPLPPPHHRHHPISIHYPLSLFNLITYPSTFSWNTIIRSHTLLSFPENAIFFFVQMRRRRLPPDAHTFPFVLKACAQLRQLSLAKTIQSQSLKFGIRPDNIALVSVLSACGRVGKLEKGTEIHNHIKQSKIQVDSFLCTALVDFYSKCGFIETARDIFEATPYKNLFTWNAMLVGLAMHGHGETLLSYFSKMVKNGVKPDGVTFLGVLVGCSHAGLIDEARRLFGEMESVYGVHRELKHYGSMADLLSRAGLIKEATNMIETMPMAGDVFVWGSLLGGCRLHGNVEVAEKAAEQIMEISPEDGGVYSSMADIYANAKRWDDLTKIRRLRDSRRVKKNAGCSLIQLDGVTHEFVAGDDLHPQTDEIYLVLNGIGQHQFEMQL